MGRSEDCRIRQIICLIRQRTMLTEYAREDARRRQGRLPRHSGGLGNRWSREIIIMFILSGHKRIFGRYFQSAGHLSRGFIVSQSRVALASLRGFFLFGIFRRFGGQDKHATEQ